MNPNPILVTFQEEGNLDTGTGTKGRWSEDTWIDTPGRRSCDNGGRDGTKEHQGLQAITRTLMKQERILL